MFLRIVWDGKCPKWLDAISCNLALDEALEAWRYKIPGCHRLWIHGYWVEPLKSHLTTRQLEHDKCVRYTPSQHWPLKAAASYFGNRTWVKASQFTLITYWFMAFRCWQDKWLAVEAHTACWGSVFAILRDPYERLVAQFRGTYSKEHPELGCDVDAGVKRLERDRRCSLREIHLKGSVGSIKKRLRRSLGSGSENPRKMMEEYLESLNAGKPWANNCNYLPQAG